MKKFLIILISVFTVGVFAAYADNDKPINVNQLPAASQQFINKYFPDSKVALAKMEKNFMNVSYDVVMTDGVKLEFDKKGEWKEVDCKYSSVPQGIVPAQIVSKVMDLYPDATIVKIDRDSKDYEIELNNGYDLTFDLSFNLIKVDH